MNRYRRYIIDVDTGSDEENEKIIMAISRAMGMMDLPDTVLERDIDIPGAVLDCSNYNCPNEFLR